MRREQFHRAEAIVAGYLAVYLALDWISFIHPYGSLGITPWNPPAGFSFALLLKFGWIFAPPFFAALVIADFVFRGLSSAPLVTIASAAGIAVLYGAAAAILRRRLAMSLHLGSPRDLLVLFAVVLVAVTMAASLVGVLFASAGLLAWDEVEDAAFHFWIGDVIGIAVATPFTLVLLQRVGSLRLGLRSMLEFVLQLAAIGAGLWVVFGLERTEHFEFAYVLFLPLIWIALRGGLPGATWGIVATQLGLVLAMLLKGVATDLVPQFQLLMLVVAVTGLLLGSVVDERRRAQLSLKQHEIELAHAARFAATGELAAALAHELNQPLTAAISFARACEAVLQSGQPDRSAAAIDLIGQSVRQSMRAGEIVRSTREFLQRGDRRPERVDIRKSLAAVIELVRDEASRHGIRLTLRAEAVPAVFADRVQLEQVALNLIRNGIEAVGHADRPRREVVVTATRSEEDPGFIEISVKDTGPGFSPDLAGRLFTPFATTKETGMGLGLSISRSIVEAHGGRIVAKPSSTGAEVIFTMPILARENDDT